jgi:hypothetical protein
LGVNVKCTPSPRFFYAVSLPTTLVGVLLALHVMPARGTSWAVKASQQALGILPGEKLDA